MMVNSDVDGYTKALSPENTQKNAIKQQFIENQNIIKTEI